MTEFIPITAKFDSVYLECMNEISTGDQILWLKGTGTKHKECPEAVQKNHELEIPEDYTTWKDPLIYSYTKVQKVTKCQKCGDTLKGDRFLNGLETGFRATCEKCV